MSQLTACPNCSAKFKEGILGTVKLLDKKQNDLIAEYSEFSPTLYCTKCGNDHLANAKLKLDTEIHSLHQKVGQHLKYIPIVTTHSPLNWDYSIVGLVTGQSTTGTGVFSEFSSSFTDLFGMQAKSYNSKIKHGENICQGQLRLSALDLGANAIIAADIDYAEVGGEKGMLMVCMSGTAIVLKNTSLLPEKHAEKITDLFIYQQRLKYLNPFVFSN